MNWRIVVTVIVAFVVGAGAGGLAEHQRAKDKSNHSSSASKKTTTTKSTKPTPTTVANLFSTKKASACPALRDWYGAIGRAAFDSAREPWATARAALLIDNAAATDAYKAMLAYTDKSGRAEVDVLIADQIAAHSALLAAKSAAAYAQAQKLKASTSAGTTKTFNALVYAVNHCAKA